MSEVISGISREAQQIKRAALTAKEIFISPHKPARTQSLIIIGFSSVIPEQVRESGILSNPQRIRAVDVAEQYMIALNDRVDIEGAKKADLEDLVADTKQREQRWRSKLDEALTNLPPEERERVRRNVEMGIKEVEFVEDWIRNKRDGEGVNFQDVDIYRTMVNAISNVALSSLIFGPGSLENRIRPIKGNMDIQSIIDKYAWVTGRNPQKEIERGVMISHNIAMVVQMMNDWRGRDYDRILNIPSYTLSVLSSVDNNEKMAKVWLDDERDKYMERAADLGIGKLATIVPVALSDIFIFAHKFLAKSGRDHAWVRDKVAKWPMGLREKAYMNRKI